MKDLTLLIPAKKEKESLPSVLNELKKFDLKILIVLEEEDVETINSIKDFNCETLIKDTDYHIREAEERRQKEEKEEEKQRKLRDNLNGILKDTPRINDLHYLFKIDYM